MLERLHVQQILDLCGALKEWRLQNYTLRWVCREVILIRDIEVWESLQEAACQVRLPGPAQDSGKLHVYSLVHCLTLWRCTQVFCPPGVEP